MEFSNTILDFIILPVYFFIFLMIGKFFYGRVQKLFKDNYFVSFFEIILGFIITICTYAIFKTGGITILWMLIILLIAQYRYFKISPYLLFIKKIKKTDIITILILFCFASFFLIIQFFRHDFFNPNIVKLGWGDYGYYSDLAESLNLNGIEKINNWYNNFNSELINYESNPSPYHYFEIWTHAFFLNFTINKGVFVFIYLFTPFICALVSFAFFVLGRSILINQTRFNIFLLFTCSILMPLFVGKLPFLKGGYVANVIYYPRNFLFYILLVLFFILIKNRFSNIALYFIAILSCVNFLYLPTVSIILVILGVFYYLNFKTYNYKKLALHSALLGVFISLFAFVFYFVIFKQDAGGGLNITAFYDIKSYIKNGIRYFFRLQLFRIWLFYLPVFLTCIFLISKFKIYDYKKILSKQYILEIIIVFTGLEIISLFFASFIPHLESGTFNSIVLNPLLAICTFIALVIVLNNIGSIQYKLLLCLIVLQIFYSVPFVVLNLGNGPYEGNVVSKVFLQDVKKLKIKNKYGVFYQKMSNIYNSPFAAKNNLSWFTAIFDVKDNGFFQVNLNSILKEEKIPFIETKDIIMNSPMYKFGNIKLKDNPSLDRDALDLLFIDTYKMEYVIFNPGVSIPAYLKPRIINIIEDSISKTKVILLR